MIQHDLRGAHGARRSMRLSLPLLATLGAWALAVLAGCGQKAEQASSSSSTSGSTSGSTSSASSGGVAAVSKYDSGPRAIETPADKALVEQGEKLFQTKGCSACHAFGKKVTGPDLAGVTRRRTAEWMENQILHPDVMTKQDPISHGLFAQFALQMPNQGLTPDEAKAVIEYFRHQDQEAGEKKN
jgi:mono/diheme cytochrome c family protein